MEMEEKKADKALQKLYQNLIKNFLTELGKIYSSYEKDGILTYEEMVKYNRLDRFLNSLLIHINQLSKDTRKYLNSLLREDYEYSYYFMSWTLERVISRKIGYSKITAEQIDAAINNPLAGLKLNDQLEKNRKDIVYRINQEVTQALVNGRTYKQTADQLKEVINSDYERAIKTSRTQIHRVVEYGTLQSAQRADSKGVKMVKIWRNMKDNRVRKSKRANHRILEGQEKPVSEPFDLGGGRKGDTPGNTGYPFHDINCRCYASYRVITVEASSKPQQIESTLADWKKALK